MLAQRKTKRHSIQQIEYKYIVKETLLLKDKFEQANFEYKGFRIEVKNVWYNKLKEEQRKKVIQPNKFSICFIKNIKLGLPITELKLGLQILF